MAAASPRPLALPPSPENALVYSNIGLDVAVWLSASLTGLVVLVKISYKYAKLQRLQPEDAFLIAASLAALGQTIAALEQVSSGLSDPLANLPAQDFEALQQTEYASQILYITADGLAKIAMALAIDHLSLEVSHKVNARSIMVVSLLWTIAAIVATATQCSQAAYPWMTYSPLCFNQIVYWDVISAFDIVLDALLVGLVAMIMWTLSITLSAKIRVIVAYGTKLISIPLVTLRVVYYRAAESSVNRPSADANVAILTQLAMTLGIMATCIPYLKALVNDMEHGLFSEDMRVKPPNSQKPDPARNYVRTAYEEKPLALEAPQGRNASMTKETRDADPPLPNVHPQRSRPRPPPVRTKLPPVKSRHISIQASAAKSPGINSPITPKMMIQKLTSFWTEEERRAPQIPPVTAHSEFCFPG